MKQFRKKNLINKWLYLRMIYIFILIIFLFSNLFISKSELFKTSSEIIFQQPNSQYLFGTDSLGRNYFIRVVLATQLSLFIGISSILFATIFSILVIYFGYMKNIIQRILKIGYTWFFSIPKFLFASLLFYYLKSVVNSQTVQLYLFICVLAFLFFWPIVHFLTSQITALKNENFIQSSFAMGASKGFVFKNHILPILFQKLKPYLFYYFNLALLYEGMFSFVGIGLSAPNESLGLLMQESWSSFHIYPYLLLAPSFVLIFITYSMNLLFFKNIDSTLS